MVLVPEPEREDTGMLLSGPQGRLLDAILGAMGLARDAVYVATVLPRHTPHADWTAIAARGLGEVARHHIGLAAPQRLIVFGNIIPPLIGHDPAHSPATFAEFYHEGGNIPVLAVRDLAVLLERPRWKAGLWQSWLEWSSVLPPGSALLEAEIR
jgi:DNA polymerase